MQVFILDLVVLATNCHGETLPFKSLMSSKSDNDNIPTNHTFKKFDTIIDNYSNICSDNKDKYVVTQKDIDNIFFSNTKNNTLRDACFNFYCLSVDNQPREITTPLLSFLDFDSTSCLANWKAISEGAKTIQTKHSMESTTTQGTYKSNKKLWMMEDVQMIEFTNSRHIQGIGVSVFDSPIFLYDLIPGQNFLCSNYLMIEF